MTGTVCLTAIMSHETRIYIQVSGARLRFEDDDIKYFNKPSQTRSPGGDVRVVTRVPRITGVGLPLGVAWPPSIRLGSHSSSAPAAAGAGAAQRDWPRGVAIRSDGWARTRPAGSVH